MFYDEIIKELQKIDTLSLPDGYLGKMDEAIQNAIKIIEFVRDNDIQVTKLK